MTTNTTPITEAEAAFKTYWGSMLALLNHQLYVHVYVVLAAALGGLVIGKLI